MRDDLRLLVDLGRLWWRRWRCRNHRDSDLVALDEEIWVCCWKCGFQSRGVVIETAAVRRAWAFDRMRLRFRQRRKAS